MAKVKKETIGKINNFLDNLEQNEQARFDKCTLRRFRSDWFITIEEW